MNRGHVTLAEVLVAARARAASMVPETAGYLALAIGDSISLLPLRLDDAAVVVTTEGNVTLTRRGDVLAETQAAVAFRDVLARLLDASIGTMPGLAAAAEPLRSTPSDMASVQRDIQAALIPLNRGAARRALARLARETQRALDSGQMPETTGSSDPRPPSALLAVSTQAASPATVPSPASAELPEQPEAQPTVAHVAAAPISPNEPVVPAHIAGSVEPLMDPTSEPTPTTVGMAPIDRDAELRSLPPARYHLGTSSETPKPAAALEEAEAGTSSSAVARVSRADELIKSFGASCTDDEGMRAAAACLRSFAGVELVDECTKPRLIDPRLLPVASGTRPPPRVVVHRFDAVVSARVPRKPIRAPVGALLATLLVGVVCGACAIKFRPGLLQHLGLDPVIAKLSAGPGAR
jgi:hypothetical protein